MKAAGSIIKIDTLGRILIPKVIRKQFNIKADEALELFVDGDNLILKKYIPKCVFCETDDDIITFMDQPVCRSCAKKLSESLENEAE